MQRRAPLIACPQISLHPAVPGTFSGRVQAPFLLLSTYLILFVNIHIKPQYHCSKIQFKFYTYSLLKVRVLLGIPQ